MQHGDARRLQYALIYVLAFCYGLAGILYLLSYRQMRLYRQS